MLRLDSSILPPTLRVGTSSFSSKDWTGGFYPADAAPADFLGLYAAQLNTVEIDATWYAVPAAATVEGWKRKVPPHFRFSLKVPRTITHDFALEGCDEEWRTFLGRVEPLGEKLSAILFQFPYAAAGKDPGEYATGADFLRRLKAFIPALSDSFSYVVEVRNSKWLRAPLVEVLARHNITLALTDYFTMPRAEEYFQLIDPLTADIGYIRLLGHHRQMDRAVAAARSAGERERPWESLLIDRTSETARWIEVIRQMLDSRTEVFAYFNNHYAGFAPGSIDLFLDQWGRESPRGNF